MILKRANTICSFDELEPMMTIETAAKIMNVTPEYLKKLSHEGIFPAFKLGKGWQITKSDLMLFVDNLRNRSIKL